MPSVNLTSLLLDEAIARGRGEADALVEPERSVSYRRLLDEVCRTGRALRQAGLSRGDRVGLHVHNSIDFAVAFLGAVRAGLVPVPMSVLLTPLDARTLSNDCEVNAVVASPDLVAAVDEVRAEIPTLRHLFAIGGSAPGVEDLQALALKQHRDLDPVAPEPGDAAFILYSAGPSGRAKGVAHGHSASLRAFAGYGKGVLGLSTEDRVLATPSLASAYGLTVGLLFPLHAGGSALLLPQRPRPKAVFDFCLAAGPTILAATPSLFGQMAHDLRALPEPRPAPCARVRLAVSGAEPLPAELAERVAQTLGVTLLHGYGTTEALSFVLSNRPGDGRPGSVGVPVPGCELRIVGDDGAPMPEEEIGRLELTTPALALGYVGAEEHTGTFLLGAGGARWFRTADRFVRDRDGVFYHAGRVDDLFKVGGRWIAPDEIERTLLRHPAVWECAVVEGHDDDGLAQPVAYVVPNIDHTPSADLSGELMAYVKREIAPYKYPRRIHFVDGLPKDERGRLQRWRLARSARGASG